MSVCHPPHPHYPPHPHHPHLVDDEAVRLLRDSAKLRVLDGLLTSIRQLQPAEKVVVVSNFTTSLDAVETIARYRRHTR